MMGEWTVPEILSERLGRAATVFNHPLLRVFQHAETLAREAEYEAHRVSNETQSAVSPAYHPLVQDLADLIPEQPKSVLRG